MTNLYSFQLNIDYTALYSTVIVRPLIGRERIEGENASAIRIPDSSKYSLYYYYRGSFLLTSNAERVEQNQKVNNCLSSLLYVHPSRCSLLYSIPQL